jgi:electron transfer flavoprotein alpha subunit
VKILAILEHQSGKLHRMSWETLAAAQQLGAEVDAAIIGSGIASLAQDVAGKKVARVFVVEHPLLENYTADGYSAAVEALIRKTNPVLVLLPHTYQTRDYAPKVATRFHRSLVSDAVAAREGGIFVRQFFQGKLQGDIRLAPAGRDLTKDGSGPHFVSLQAGAWRADALESGSATVETFTPELTASQIRQVPEPPFRESARAVDLTAAEIIVSVGRGIGDKDKIPVVEDLARALGAELAASRPICDAGWLPMERQVGSSGQTVAPKMYVAVGISGAIQHLVGMKGSKTIVAINKDANAPIFEVADYGIVGDLFEVVPALAEEIRKAKA